MSPGSWGISLGRRGKRLEEQVLLAQMVRRGSAMVPSPMRQRHQSGPGGFSAAKQGRLGGAAAARAEPPVTRRRIARLADGAPNSAADASVDSAVDAPEWRSPGRYILRTWLTTEPKAALRAMCSW